MWKTKVSSWRHLSRSSLKTVYHRRYHAKSGCYGFNPTPRSSSHPLSKPSEEAVLNRVKNANLVRLVAAYRERGHLLANVNPLRANQRNPQLDLSVSSFGLENSDANAKFKITGIVDYGDKSEATLQEIVDHLDKTYCGELSVEVQQMEDESEQTWFSNLVEQSTQWSLQQKRQKHLAKLLLQSQAFDNFLARKYATVKRYGGEGAESMMGFFDELFLLASHVGIQDVVIGMPHRGRLNLLTGLMKFSVAEMFSKMKGNSELPPGAQGSGDVLSHLFKSVDLDYGDSHPLHVNMMPNPSHLEAVNPVVNGKVRGRHLTLAAGHYAQDPNNEMGDKVLSVVVHGDASFPGQGIVAEGFCLANLPHYSVGGTVHLIVNNQLGFTTPADRGRSSMYSSDVGKMTNCPVIHVNGDYPEEVVRACRLAMEYRNKFRKDVIVDMMCFRRWGHNELDDPSFTQPSMYSTIRSRKSVPDLYAESLVTQRAVTQEELTSDVTEYNAVLNEELKNAETCVPQTSYLEGRWKNMVQPSTDKVTTWDTGVPVETLQFVGARSVHTPEDFALHPHLNKTHVEARQNKLRSGEGLDWATAEAMAFGSLLYQGYHVRISGQDVGRGTFSHRHAMFVDQNTDNMYIPLNNIWEGQQQFLEVANSPLSEEAVLGFEYGMSVENPDHLIVWEAQFGDFFNGAQIIIDTFISSGETKWLQQSGLVMLLPHGYDGAGPEHSSCRVERFLQMCDSKEDDTDSDNVNMNIVNPTTPAQYFHLIRRQMVRNFRKPLIVVAPKLLLRLPVAVSSLGDLAPGTHFKPVLGDVSASCTSVRRVVFCAGKHYYALAKRRETEKRADTAIIRLEEFSPFPSDLIRQEIQKYPEAKEFIWSQEEHRNMGAWSFVAPRFENLLGVKLRYAGRQVLATPAVGVSKIHHREVEEVLGATFPV